MRNTALRIVPLIVILTTGSLAAEQPQATSMFEDESRRFKLATTILSRVSDRVRELETDWVERPRGESSTHLHWRMRSRADEVQERLLDADVRVSILAYPTEEKATEYLDGRRYWGFSIRYPELNGLFDDHRGAAGPYEQKPATYFALNCRLRNIMIWVFAPSPEIAIRFAKLVAMELPKPEDATE